jgi:hypothetical protein
MNRYVRALLAGTAVVGTLVAGGGAAFGAAVDTTAQVSPAAITTGVVASVNGTTIVVHTDSGDVRVDTNGATIQGRISVGKSVNVTGATVNGVINASLVVVLP